MRGCSHNKCTFCNMFLDVDFEILPLEVIFKDIEDSAKDLSEKFIHKISSIYLVGGDPVIIPTEKLLKILNRAKKHFTHLKRVACYATAKAIIAKGPENMKLLKKAGLKRLYIGMESGSEEILKKIDKGCITEDIVLAASYLKEAGLESEFTMMLGIGGRELSKEHALKTAELINKTRPDQVSLTTLVPKENTPLGQDYLKGKFQLMEPEEVLSELKTLVENIHCPVKLNGKHWLNFLLFEHPLPEEKEVLLKKIDEAIAKPRSDFRPLAITSQRG